MHRFLDLCVRPWSDHDFFFFDSGSHLKCISIDTGFSPKAHRTCKPLLESKDAGLSGFSPDYMGIVSAYLC